MTAQLPLRSRHAVVTGGGHGIGASIAGELAKLGAQVTLLGRNRTLLDAHAEVLRTEWHAEVAAICCDITDGGSVERAFGAARDNFGPPYVLVNNAGQAESAGVLETTRELWDRMLSINLSGAFLCAQQVLAEMLESRSGRIINIASTAGLKGYSHLVAYCASKHGLIGLTRALAIETAKMGITVNAVCPAYTEGTMTEKAIESLSRNTGKTPDEARETIVRVIPRRKLMRAEEVSYVVGWLCGDHASGITGQAIAVAGGEVM